MEVTTRVEMDVNRVMNRFNPLFQKAQQFMDSEVLKDCEPYVPFATGNLARSGPSGTHEGSGKVVWVAPYARELYYATSRRFNPMHHPQACAQWFEKAKAQKKEAWVRGASDIIKGG